MKLEPSFGASHPQGEPNASSNVRANLARRCSQLALALFLLALVPTLLAIWGERRTAVAGTWHDPASDIQPAAIAPDLALLSLAGVSDERVLALAIEAQELESVRALLTFSADLTDQQRINGWLWLAYRYQEAQQTQPAAQAYRLAGGGAILAERLPDLLRTETLLTVGRQLTILHDKPSAHFYLRQAALIGTHAPRMTDYARHQLLEQLIPAILQAGGKRDDWIALAKAVQSGTSRGAGAPYTEPNVTPGQDALLVKAQDNRRAAAAALLTSLAVDADKPSSGPRPIDDALFDALRRALLAEDAAVASYLDHEAGLAAQETRLGWLLLKRRIAAGGAGVGLVTEWESNREQVDAALTAAWADWLALHSDPTSNDSSRVSGAARHAIVAAHWGLFPAAPVADLAPKAQSLSDFGGLHLTVIKPGTPPLLGWSEN